jgi:hypothetical protein
MVDRVKITVTTHDGNALSYNTTPILIECYRGRSLLDDIYMMLCKQIQAKHEEDKYE